MISVILSGGSGTRLWPLSTPTCPKQFVNFFGEKTLFEETLLRAKDVNSKKYLVVGNVDHKFLILDQFKSVDIHPKKIILEPCKRNTAAAIASACFSVLEDEDDLILVMPADHMIADVNSFKEAISKGIEFANNGGIVTFGIIPNKPHTGYGYIEVKEKKEIPQKVINFIEKPNQINAEKYLDEGRYYWNAGIFLFKASVMLKEIKEKCPEIYELVKLCIESSKKEASCILIDAENYVKVPDISIDYAVMEKSNNIFVVPMDVGWSDLGAWSSMIELAKKDEKGNVIDGNVITENVKNSYVRAESKMVALLGVEDLVVVETMNAVLVTKKNQTENVKKIATLASANKHEKANSRAIVQRPWGQYESIDKGSRYQVKKIRIFPGESISVQMHHHRAEHWVVVEGTAKVCIDGKVSILTENQSVYIPLGAVHSLENPGLIPLDIIEVQSGAYLGEDDIVRFEDKYGRK